MVPLPPRPRPRPRLRPRPLLDSFCLSWYQEAVSALSAAERAAFARQGFLVLRQLLDSAELAALRAETAALVDAATTDPAFRSHPDYWYNDDMPAEWYRRYADTQLPPSKSSDASS